MMATPDQPRDDNLWVLQVEDSAAAYQLAERVLTAAKAAQDESQAAYATLALWCCASRLGKQEASDAERRAFPTAVCGFA